MRLQLIPWSLCMIVVGAASTLWSQGLMNVPVRVNMGGVQTVDSFGRTWLGDGPGAGDPLNIRPDDAGGAESAENWSLLAFQPDSLDALGFDSTHPGDSYIFNTIRWDNAALPGDFRLDLPLPEGTYTVNLYFNEGCCPARHFQLEIQGVIVDEDVSYIDYDTLNPALGRVGVMSFPGQAVGPDQSLKLGLLPCNVAECPDGTDFNAILDALEVVSAPSCDHLGTDFNATYRPATNDVVGTWNANPGADGYRVLKNGAVFGPDLPAGANSFTDSNPSSGGVYVRYELFSIDGGVPFGACRSSVLARSCPTDLACSVDQGSGQVSLTWSVGGGLVVSGFEVRRNGTLLATLSAATGTYEDTPAAGRNFTYTVTPLTDAGNGCSVLSCSVVIESNVFEIPLRINMGGVETVDSKGRLWLGDGPGVGDPLSIRPDDFSAINTIENWCVPEATTLRNLGFDPTHPGDRYILGTIRWDNGPLLQPGDASVYYLELPIPNGSDYFVNLYFNECCCANRHFKIEIQGEILNEDVSFEDYANPPALTKVGRLSFKNIVVDTEILRIGLIPCEPPESCPGVGDDNAILNAIEVVTNPCLEAGFRQCPTNLKCTLGLLRRVVGTWDPPLCMDGQVTGYEVYKDGALINTLPADALSFIDTLQGRTAFYEVKTLTAAGIEPCPPMSCSAVNPAAAFTVPVRINLGGRFLTDSRGNKWIGDLGGPGDSLDIRPDDLGGALTVESWCPQTSFAEADSLQSLGLDPTSANDQGIFNTIRYDDGAAIEEYRLEIPIANGNYLLNLYFTECCCLNRHAQLEVEGSLYIDDLHAGVWSSIARVGRTGRVSFDDVAVTDGALSIAFLPCFVCDPNPFPAVDGNALCDAVEVLPAGTVNQTCPRELVCEFDGATVSAYWTGPDNVAVTGYEVYRNGSKIATLPGNAGTFEDLSPPCERALTYEVAVLGAALCPTLRMRCTILQPECSWVAPVRINMGGSEIVDSQGNTWLGDGPGPGDPLDIRLDDGSGTNWIENWSTGIMDPASFTALGLNPDHPGDRYIFNTIRWDVGADGVDFVMEFPIADGEYDVNMYFNEACCSFRHFQIEAEGVILDDDVSYNDYGDAPPALGKLGRLTFNDISVEDGALTLALRPCPQCPGALDTNAIINALEILGEGGPPVGPIFHRGDADQNGQLQLTDAVQVLGFLFLGIPTKVPDCLDAADADDNGQIQLTDAVRILAFLFLGGPVPAPPGPPPAACDVDPTPDDALDPCGTFVGC